MTSVPPRDIVADYQPTLQDAFRATAILAVAIDDLTAENADLRQRIAAQQVEIDDLRLDLADKALS